MRSKGPGPRSAEGGKFLTPSVSSLLPGADFVPKQKVSLWDFTAAEHLALSKQAPRAKCIRAEIYFLFIFL